LACQDKRLNQHNGAKNTLHQSTSTQVVVLGSTNWDICMYLPSLPKPGDTVGAGRLQTAIGGKGANQAVACYLAGAPCQFVSCIGDDASASTIVQTFDELGLNTESVFNIADCATGTACIFIDTAGENCIGLTAGANAHLDTVVVNDSRQMIQEASVLLMQLETPLDSVLLAATLANQSGTQVILNPAPACPLPAALYPLVNILTPNRGELALLSGVDTSSQQGLEKACTVMLAKGVERLLVTLGSDGVMLASEAGITSYSAFNVEAVDTTAAGDVFNGYFAAQLSNIEANGGETVNEEQWQEAIEQAMAAAAIAVTQEGAIPSIPSKQAVADFRQYNLKHL